VLEEEISSKRKNGKQEENGTKCKNWTKNKELEI
jgi:hypothetical protein